jgi:hypothetical protein
MSDDEKKKPTRLFIASAVNPARAVPEFLFVQAKENEEVYEATQRHEAEGWTVGPVVEVPMHARGVVHAVIEEAFAKHNALPGGKGETLFIGVTEIQKGGFSARVLTQPASVLGWADLVSMAGDVGSEHGTPGEALGAIAAGLDRMLALEAWRASFGTPEGDE